MDTAGDISPSEKEALAKEFRDLEEIRTREAKSRAVVLEILGDIPDADITPPKNVLFVCKLNPVTEEGDLKIIFSRFGNVKKCDIIKDYVTGDSLQYAFIEFETEESCNEAYFKMQNVLIDDRRIHVDFCQSVSGFWKRYYHNETFTRKRKERSDNRKNDNHRDDHRHSHKRPSTHDHKKHRKHYSEDRGSHRRHDSRSDRDRKRRRSIDSDRRSHRSSRDSGKHRRRERSRSSSMDPFGRRKKGLEKYARRSSSRSRDRNRRSRSRSSSVNRKSRRSFS